MKIFFLFLIVLLTFFGCAFVGYQFAIHNTPQVALVETGGNPSFKSEQRNFMVMRVDDLTAPKPKLISVWYISLFFLNDNPNSLTLAQVYPPRVPSTKSITLERSFELTSDGEPSSGFWDAVKRYDFNWEGYIMLDTEGANQFLQWLVGQNDFHTALDESTKSIENSQVMAEQVCRSVTDSSDHSIAQFDWNQVVPAHFRSSLRMETGLAIWNRMTEVKNTVECVFLAAP
jgi:hypothetical protein